MAMSLLVLECGSVSAPTELAGLPRVAVPVVPGRAEIDPVIPLHTRLVVVGGDAALAAVVTRLLRADRLDVEVAYVPVDRRSAAARVYGLPTGPTAARAARAGVAVSLPLIRDDAGVALVGAALLTGPDGAELVGEAYVDNTRLFSGPLSALEIRPTPLLPGLRAARQARWPRRRWLPGRAIQVGGQGISLTRDGVTNKRVVKRSTFYRHVDNWSLVHPHGAVGEAR
jgi:hypothetical protein